MARPVYPRNPRVRGAPFLSVHTDRPRTSHSGTRLTVFMSTNDDTRPDRPDASRLGGPSPADLRFHRGVLRQLIGAIATLALIGGLSAGGVAAAASASTTSSTMHERDVVDAELTSTLEAVLADLDAAQLAVLTDAATGMRLGDLSAGQRIQILTLFRAVLSDDAYSHLLAMMNADDALDAAAGGGTACSSDEYTVTVLFDDATGSVFLQLSGTQLAISVVVAEDTIFVEPEVLGG